MDSRTPLVTRNNLVVSRTESFLFAADDLGFATCWHGEFKFQFPVGSRPRNSDVPVRRGDDSFGPIEAAGLGSDDEAFEARLQWLDTEDA